MRQVWPLTVFSVLAGSGVTTAQTPETVYEWAGVPSNLQEWRVWGSHNFVPGFNTATISATTGDLVVTETGTGDLVGQQLWITDEYGRPRETAPAKGGLDTSGLDFVEVDLRHSHPTGSVDVSFYIQTTCCGMDRTVFGSTTPVGPGLNTIRFPLDVLTRQQQAMIDLLWLWPQPHAALGNLTWTISEVRTVGTPLAYRDIVTNDVGSPDDGLDGAFPLNTADMLAIVGNMGVANQEGLSRNPAGTGSLQWTDRGGSGVEGDESGASIGWGNGAGWRNAQPGSPTSGNSYNERIADFSNYDRMTVTISALDAVNPAGTVGIEGMFLVTDPTLNPPTILPSQDLPTDGQYHDLVYDLSSVTFLKNIWHWGLDVSPHPNDIVFNIDNIRLWNSTVPPGVPGDYNNDGTVDAADYVVWRSGGALQNEGVTPGSNTPEDYDFWRSRFGATAGSGSAATIAAVPEPAPVLLLTTTIIGLWWRRRGS